MITINAPRALELLEEAVAKYGEDYVYPGGDDGGCQYQLDGIPSCGVGVALSLAGAPITLLSDLDVRGMLIDTLKSRRVLEDYSDEIEITEGALRVLEWFQVVQDSRKRWGEALEVAKNEYNLLVPSLRV